MRGSKGLATHADSLNQTAGDKRETTLLLKTDSQGESRPGSLELLDGHPQKGA